MKTLVILLALALFYVAPACAEDDLVVDYTIYSAPFGVVREGVWVAIGTQNPAIDAFIVTLRYQDPVTGEPRVMTQITRRTYYSNMPAVWSNELFWVGRVKVLSVAVATLRITGGKTFKVGVDFAEK